MNTGQVLVAAAAITLGAVYLLVVVGMFLQSGA